MIGPSLRHYRAAFLAASLALPGAALAQSVNVVDITALIGAPSGALSQTAAKVVPAVGDPTYSPYSADRRTLYIGDNDTAVSFSCGYSSAITYLGAGTFQVFAGQPGQWWGDHAPVNAIWCIAPSGTTPKFSVEVGN